MLERLDLRGNDGDLPGFDWAVALAPPPRRRRAGRGRPRDHRRRPRPRRRRAARADRALRRLRVDDLRVPPARAPAPRSTPPTPELRAALEVRRRPRSPPTTRPSAGTELDARARTGCDSRELALPVDRAGLYVPGGRGRVPVDRADDRDPGPGRRRAPSSCCACRPAATAPSPDADPRRRARSPASTRCTASAARAGDRRARLRHRVDPARST